MKLLVQITAHARERWAERVGRGCIWRSLRRAAPPGPELLSGIATNHQDGTGVVILYDRKMRVAFICRDQDRLRRILTVIRLPARWECDGYTG